MAGWIHPAVRFGKRKTAAFRCNFSTLTRIAGKQHAGPRDVRRGRHVKRERCGGSVRRTAKRPHCVGSTPP